VTPAGFAQHAAPASTHDQTFLDQVRFYYIFDSIAGFCQSGGQSLDSDRPAGVVIGHSAHVAAVHRVEAAGVDLQTLQGVVGDRAIHQFLAGDGGEVADSAKQPAGDAGGAAGAAGDFGGAVL